jgi:hypothetical protein
VAAAGAGIGPETVAPLVVRPGGGQAFRAARSGSGGGRNLARRCLLRHGGRRGRSRRHRRPGTQPFGVDLLVPIAIDQSKPDDHASGVAEFEAGVDAGSDRQRHRDDRGDDARPARDPGHSATRWFGRIAGACLVERSANPGGPVRRQGPRRLVGRGASIRRRSSSTTPPPAPGRRKRNCLV